jgi:hypothetical protein
MILPLAKRTARRLWCIRLFATFSVQPCTAWKLGCGIVDLTTKDTKSTKLSEQEAFDAIFQFRPEVSVNRDCTTAHLVRQLVEFHLRALRVFRGDDLYSAGRFHLQGRTTSVTGRAHVTFQFKTE